MSVELDDVKFVVAFQASARMHGDCASGSLASSQPKHRPRVSKNGFTEIASWDDNKLITVYFILSS